MKKKNPIRRRRTVVAAQRIPRLGELALVRFGTQFYCTVNGVKLESVRTIGSAKRMFETAIPALKGKKVVA